MQMQGIFCVVAASTALAFGNGAHAQEPMKDKPFRLLAGVGYTPYPQ